MIRFEGIQEPDAFSVIVENIFWFLSQSQIKAITIVDEDKSLKRLKLLMHGGSWNTPNQLEPNRATALTN